MDNINNLNDSSYILKYKISSKIISWQIILILSLILFLNISLYYKYSKYISFIGQVIEKDNQYHLQILLPEEKLSILDDYKLLIDNNYINYEILEIKDIYQLDENLNKYYELIIKVSLKAKYQKNNLPIPIKLESKPTTLMTELINKLKKGMME